MFLFWQKCTQFGKLRNTKDFEIYSIVFVLQSKTKIKVHGRKHKQLYTKAVKLITACYLNILSSNDQNRIAGVGTRFWLDNMLVHIIRFPPRLSH